MGLLDFVKDLAPALPIVGDIVGGVSSAKEAKKNREFQQYMSDTAHQREVKDLRAAGLNPILSGTGGAGASTPSGSVAQVPDYGGGIASAIQGKKQRDLMDAQIDQANAATAKTQAETDGITLDNVDKQNRNDAQWGTGGKPGQVYAENQARLEEAKSRILESRARTDSARESARKENLLNAALEADPGLAKWVLSASKQEYETINRALSSSRTPADVIKALKALIR